MGQAFLCADAILQLYYNVIDGLVVYPKVIKKNIAAELPFMATENILMECVKRGGNRQELHEKIRVHSMEAGKQVKIYGKNNDLIQRLKGDPAFAEVISSVDGLLDPKKYVGRAPEQVSEYVRSLRPIFNKYKDQLHMENTIKV